MTTEFKLHNCGAQAVFAVVPFNRDEELWVCEEHVRPALCLVLELDFATLEACGHGYDTETILWRRMRPDELLEVRSAAGAEGNPHGGECEWSGGLEERYVPPLAADTRN